MSSWWASAPREPSTATFSGSDGEKLPGAVCGCQALAWRRVAGRKAAGPIVLLGWLVAYADAPASLIARILIPPSIFDERFNLRAIQIGPHDSHSLAVTPIELAAVLVEVQLLRRMSKS